MPPSTRTIRHLAEADKNHTGDDEEAAESEKRNVVEELVRTGPDVVDPEQLVIDRSLGEVESAPADQHEADQRADAVGDPPAGSPQEHEPDRHEQPGRGVEEAVREGVRLEPGDGGLGIALGAREHVVPLQDLVQHDAVHEAAEAYAQEDPGCRERPSRRHVARFSLRSAASAAK